MEADLSIIEKEDGSTLLGVMSHPALNLMQTIFKFENPTSIKRKLIEVNYDMLYRIMSDLIEHDPKKLFLSKVWCMADSTVYLMRFTKEDVGISGIEVYQ